MIEKLKNWWISIMPSIGLAPVVEETVTDYEKFDTILTYLGIVHGYKIVDFSVKHKNSDGSYRIDERDFEQHIVVKRDNKGDLADIKFDKLGKIVSVENKCYPKS